MSDGRTQIALSVPPPQALEAEDNTIGAMMMSSKALDVCSEILNGEEFYRHSNGAIFRACLSLHERNEAVDSITVTAEMERNGTLKVLSEPGQVHELDHAGDPDVVLGRRDGRTATYLMFNTLER